MQIKIYACWQKQNACRMIGIVSLNYCPTFKTPIGTGGYVEWGKNSTGLHQIKSQLGQRVVGTAQRIPSTWSKHTLRDCIVWDREEKKCRAVGFSRGGIFHLCQPPLDASPAPARLSRALYTTTTPPARRSRLCQDAYTWSRYRAHDHEEKRERK